jgi:dual specificity MAP kinase phosphatase
MLENADIHTPSALPTEIIPGFLFIGSFDHASRADLLKTLGITHILNVSIF